MANWIDMLFSNAHLPEPANPISFGYGVTSSLEPEGWHHGVDVPLAGGSELITPISGTYDPRASGKYRAAIDLPNGDELIYAHILNRFYGSGPIAINANTDLGTVLSTNPETGLPFSQSEYYTDPAGGWYSETGPHVHIEAHTSPGSFIGSDNVFDPTTLTVGTATGTPTPTPTPTSTPRPTPTPTKTPTEASAGNESIQFGPWQVPNPGAVIADAMTGVANSVGHAMGAFVTRLVLTMMFVGTGILFIVVAFKKPIEDTVETAARVAA